MAKRKTKTEFAAELRELADQTANAALTAAPGYQLTVMHAAEKLGNIANNMARKQDAEQPAVLVLPDNATNQELSAARTRQSAKRGREVYLPSWSSVAQALPDTFLRTALFTSSTFVQRQNDLVLAGDSSLLVADDEIASFKDIRLLFSGYRLCQYDRQVYATCLEYYREHPLAPEDSTRHICTTFHAFADRMGSTHNAKTYLGIRASLRRLSVAQMRLRHKRLDIEVPKLLSVSFDDGSAAGGEMQGSDKLLLRVTEPIAELFGVACWTAVNKTAVDYDGLRGWLANFYATHSKAKWIPVETLYRLSGYESRMTNFRDGLTKALDKLMEPNTPSCSRVAKYNFSKDKTTLYVVREEWLAKS